MSKLQNLIAELFPNGVTFQPMGELIDYYGGLTGKSINEFNQDNSKFITYLNVFSNLAVDTSVLGLVTIEPFKKQRRVAVNDILFTGSSETSEEC
ncbi:MAG: hypothetical protein LBR53_08730 [Deltaproteobacteria bacterium]|jgi:type I restriction enzyme S subunit|nr:hypothetical protein [Deltaproteobacteria bacterium]